MRLEKYIRVSGLLKGDFKLPYHKSLYRFKCFFNKRVWCGEFNPRIWKKRHRLPEPCKRCKFYLNRVQKTLYPFSGAHPLDIYVGSSKIEENKAEKHKERGG